MFYACIMDRWTDELITADQCETYEEAARFCAEELSNLWPSEKAVVLTANEYRKAKERI